MCRWLLRATWVGVASLCISISQAADYPSKTVTIICPWSPGGGTDRVSRFWAEALQREFGQPFVVVNRTGGAGAVGHFAAAHAKPDGHTIGMITFELSTMHRMRISRLTFEDYECLMQINSDPAAIVVRADAPWKSLQEWLDDVRANPGKLKMSGTATGGAWDLARAGLFRAAELPVESVVWVPHPGAAPSLMELIGGHVDAVCCSVPEVAPQIKAGEVRVLGVMAEDRLADFPDLPTVREQGVDWVAVGWRGLALPKETPAEIVNALKERCLKIAESPEYAEFMKKNGFGITIRTTDDFRDFLREQDQQWKEVVEAAGYQRGLTGNHDPGPLALPLILVIGLALCGGWELLASRPADRAPRETEGRSKAKLVLTSAGLVVYVVAINWLGFALSSFLFLSVTTYLLGARWWAAMLGAALIVVCVWLLFVHAFHVQLPAGVLGLPF